jgi:CelD/BcsL family acetyltransferase involved in cellulose biosynthesis
MADIAAGFAPPAAHVVPLPVRAALDFAAVPAAGAARLAPAWAALAAAATADNFFFLPQFVLPAMHYLGQQAAVATVTRPDGSLAALAPFTHTRLGRIAPAVRLWAHDYAPLGVPLVDAAEVAPAVARLLDGLAPPDSGAAFIAADLPLAGPVFEAFVAAARYRNRPVDILDGHVRATLDRSDDPDALNPRGVLPSRRRKEYARQMRRLADTGEVQFVAAIDPAEVRARFEAFLLLEAAGWKGRRGTALGSTDATREFAREAVAAHAEAGGARIDSIDLGGRPIAMVVSFAAGATAWTWKIAYDENFGRFSPGAQLMLEIPKAIFSDPTIVRIDSCAAADHPMIDHLWAGRLPIGTVVIGPPGGSAIHRVGLAAARAELAARAAVRRLRR